MTDSQSLLGNIFTLFTWGGVSALLLFLFAIARFYERKSSRSSYYPLFLFPVVLFFGSALRYIITDDFVGDPWADLGRVLGGVMVCGLGIFLLNLMTGGR
jgi:hypothetical protein